MMKKASIFLISILLILLGGCTLEITDGDSLDNPTDTFNAVENPQQALASGSITSTNTADFYRVNVPNNLNGDVIYLELGDKDKSNNLILTVYNSSKNAVRESDSANFFGIIGSGLTSSNLESQAIGVDLVCRGPCVITDIGTGVLYVKIETKGATSAIYDFYAYSDDYQDSTDPANNPTKRGNNFFCDNIQVAAIVPIPTTESYIGAIETVEDIECFKTQEKVAKVTLDTFPATTIHVTAEVYRNNQLLGTIVAPPRGTATKSLSLEPSAIVPVPVPNDVVTVIIFGGDPNSNIRRAAAAGNSKYKLTFE